MRDRDYVYLQVNDPGQECPAKQFGCGDGTCISNSLRCNSKYDCPDMSDESGCDASNSNAPFEDVVELGATLILQCELSNRSQGQPIKWYRMIGNQPTEQFADNVHVDRNVIRIQDARPDNRGIYRCELGGMFKDYLVTMKG